VAPVPLRLRRSAPPGRGRRCSGSIRRRALNVLAYRGRRYIDVRDDAIGSGVSVWGHSTGRAPTRYSPAARRRAPRSALVAPRGSGRSRRAGPQRQTRPEARTHGRARLQAVVLGPEITPHSLWKLWVTRVCEPRALHASGWATRSRRDSTRSRPVRQPPKRSGRPDLRGGAAELGVHDYSLKAGAGRERLPHGALGVGERLPSPRLYTHCWQGHKTESRSAHTSQAVGAPGFEPGTSCPPDLFGGLAGNAGSWRAVADVQGFRPLNLA